MFEKNSPLSGIRVLSYGGIWAGRVASLLLAEQGAEVIEVNRPGYASSQASPLLGREKTSIEIDLKTSHGRSEVHRLALGAHIVIDNLGANRALKFGIGYEQIVESNKQVIYASIPGFGKGDPMENVPAWEGTIGAATGLFTNIPALGKLLGTPPKFTSLPMGSALAGVHASIACTLAFYHRLNTGIGQRLEVSLADSVISAMAIHAMDIEERPARYDMPPIDKVMTEVAFPVIRDLSDQLSSEQWSAINAYLERFRNPLVGNYKCADGRLLFVHATEHISQTRSCLQSLGLLDRLIADGMVLASPYAVSSNGNNLCDSASMAPHWRKRLARDITSCFATKPADHWEALLRAAKVPATVVRTTQEWLCQQTLRDAEIVAYVDDPNMGKTWQPGRIVSIEGIKIKSRSLTSSRLGVAGQSWQSAEIPISPIKIHDSSSGILHGVKVLDFSNIIAGPVSGRVLAEFGANVTRVEAPSSVAGPRMTLWFGVDVNQGKRSLILDLKTAEGQGILSRLIQSADVVLHNSLDETAASLGLSHDQLAAINPNIVSCQVSAWGGPLGGRFKNDPAWDPVLQAASGITTRYGTLEQPVHHGNPSTVDFITGYSAALGIAQALVARRLGQGGSHVQTSLAMGAQLIQFPFMVDAESVVSSPEPSDQNMPGYGAHYRLYKAKRGWAFFACRIGDLERIRTALDAKDATDAALAEAIVSSDLVQLQERIAGIEMASIVAVRTLEDLRSENTYEENSFRSIDTGQGIGRFARARDPDGRLVIQPLPTWYRLERTPIAKLTPAPYPGADSRAILQELGMAELTIAELFDKGIVRDTWPMLNPQRSP